MMADRRWFWALGAAALLAAWPDVAGAADGEVRTRAPATLTQETVGLELTPVSMALGQNPGASVSRFDAGLGGSLRFFRHRWERLYFTPVQAGLYVSSVSDTFLVHLQTEAGVIVPRTARRLELGLGTGVGGLFIDYASRCEDALCRIGGGAGWMTSVVARYLVVDRPGITTGIGLRAVAFPLRPSDWLGGAMVLAVLDVGFGRSTGAEPAPSQLPPLPRGPAD